jgi:hypothetical protein
MALKHRLVSSTITAPPTCGGKGRPARAGSGSRPRGALLRQGARPPAAPCSAAPALRGPPTCLAAMRHFSREISSGSPCGRAAGSSAAAPGWAGAARRPPGSSPAAARLARSRRGSWSPRTRLQLRQVDLDGRDDEGQRVAGLQDGHHLAIGAAGEGDAAPGPWAQRRRDRAAPRGALAPPRASSGCRSRNESLRAPERSAWSRRRARARRTSDGRRRRCGRAAAAATAAASLGGWREGARDTATRGEAGGWELIGARAVLGPLKVAGRDERKSVQSKAEWRTGRPRCPPCANAAALCECSQAAHRSPHRHSRPAALTTWR